MKNITVISLFACLSILLLSCQKEDVVNPASSAATAVIPAKTIESPVSNPNPVIGNVNTDVTITGNWKVVKDSTYSKGIGASTIGTGTNYDGTDGDHFTFTTYGKVYIKEGDTRDTANYIITSDKKIILNYLYYQGVAVTNYGSVVANFNQLNLTANTVTLSSSIITPGSSFARIIYLKR